jgi:hypothetical protein
MNAAVWFGGSLFMMVGVAPAVFASEMDRLGDLWKGFIAFHLFERYFALQYWCGAVAIAHLFAEWVYLGKPLYRLSLGLVLGVFCLGLAGGLVVQPRLKQLHTVKYANGETEARKTAAARSLNIWSSAGWAGTCGAWAIHPMPLVMRLRVNSEVKVDNRLESTTL